LKPLEIFRRNRETHVGAIDLVATYLKVQIIYTKKGGKKNRSKKWGFGSNRFGDSFFEENLKMFGYLESGEDSLIVLYDFFSLLCYFVYWLNCTFGPLRLF
jgi:hypothetical protein